jgi:hypothetical protein
MIKKFLLFTFSAGFFYLSLSSNAIGPAHAGNKNRTGSPGSAGTCASSGCHTGSSTPATVQILIRKKSAGLGSLPVPTYEPGQDYIVTINGLSSSRTKFGFQLVALNGSNQSVGTFSNFPANVGTAVSDGITIVEHTATISGGSPQVVSFDWKAPSSITDRITFYGIVNGVDGNGNSTNDAVSQPVQTRLSPTSVADIERKIEVKAFPNPAKNTLVVQINNANTGTYTINAFDLTGKKMMEKIVDNNDISITETIDTEKWASGLYYVQITKDGMKLVTPVMKN